jgi:hypothetical protein
MSDIVVALLGHADGQGAQDPAAPVPVVHGRVVHRREDLRNGLQRSVRTPIAGIVSGATASVCSVRPVGICAG